MKPYSADTEPFRSVDDFQSLRVEPLTVLFGRNNAGKSNALGALTQPLGIKASASGDERDREIDLSRPLGRFWVAAPEDGSPWDRRFRREVYVRLLHERTPSPRTPFASAPNLDETRDSLSGLSIDALAEALVELELAQSFGAGDLEGRAESAAALRELLRRSLFGFTEGDLQLGFPSSAITPDVDALVRTAAQWTPLAVPPGWGVGMEFDDETAVLIDHTQAPFRPVVLSADWSVDTLEAEIDLFLSTTRRSDDSRSTWPLWAKDARPWLLQSGAGEIGYRLNSAVTSLADDLTMVANRFLPEFLRGTVEVSTTSAELWDQGTARVVVKFDEEGLDVCAGYLADEGSGVARWSAVALRFAMEVVKQMHARGDLDAGSELSLDGFVIVLDEPEAHLHPAAVRDVVEWCYQSVERGACVLVATHHEEFLGRLRDGTSLIHVTKPERPTESRLRPVESSAIGELQLLAKDVGLSAGAALALYKAVLFVEGPLDVAVLDEYAGTRLEAAGVLLVPIHGTKNLEGLVTSEVIQRLECLQGVLLDATDVATLRDRPKKKLSSEEKKVLRVIDIARSQGQQEPRVFGVTVRDLLYSLDENGLRDFGAEAFPGWGAIDAEARAHFGVDGSQSVNWKAYVNSEYGVPLETVEGVRRVVRWLDMHGYDNPEIARLVDEIVDWAKGLADSEIQDKQA